MFLKISPFKKWILPALLLIITCAGNTFVFSRNQTAIGHHSLIEIADPSLQQRAASSHLFDCSILPTREMRVSVIVNSDHYKNITDQDIKATFKIASDDLYLHTCTVYSVQEIIYAGLGQKEAPLVLSNFLRDRSQHHPSSLPDYVVIFLKDSDSVGGGGYQLASWGESNMYDLQWLMDNAGGSCNSVGSPYKPPGVVYGAVVDWAHLIGACGYKMQGLDWVPDGTFTSSQGQCRNVSGLQCIYAYGEWQCPNLLNDPETRAVIENRALFRATTINHELMHNFGYKGPLDHGCSNEVPEELKKQSAFNMCGEVINRFKFSTPRCVNDTRELGDSCLYSSQCGNHHCVLFQNKYYLHNECSMNCLKNSDCPSMYDRPGLCRITNSQDLNSPFACYYGL